jgi:hypothetical protein
LLTDALVLNLLTFALLGWGVWRLAAPLRARWPEVTAPLVWLASLGGGIGSNRMLLNYRNLELGLSFAFLALAAIFLTDDWGRRKAPVLLSFSVVLSVFWLDDPYFALLVGVPFILACGFWFVFRERSPAYLHLALCVVVSLVLLPFWHALLRAFGFHVGGTGGGVSLNPATWWDDLGYLWSGISIQLGIDPAAGLSPARVFLVLALVASVLASVAVAWHGWRNRRFVVCFVGVHWPLVVAGYLASSTAAEHGSSRYLILGVYDLAVCVALALPLIRRRSVGLASSLIMILIVSAVLNVIPTARASNDPAPPLTVAREQQLSAVLSTGLAKGYGQFWSGNVLIYLSGGRVTVNAVRCSNGSFVYDSWLTDTARYRRVHAASTFLIWEPSVPYFTGCSRAQVDSLLGPPSRELPAGAGSTVLVYPYDIGPRLLGHSLLRD